MSVVDPSVVRSRVAEVRARIAACGRDASEVRIIAVTKGFGGDAARIAVEAGLVDLGESYAQELVAKAPAAPGARWHFLGPIQRNKVKSLAPHVSLWHGVDREAVGEAILRHGAPAPAPVLVQVNLAEDPARPGVGWGDAADLVARLRASGLDVRGLMGVASRDPERARAEFRRLARLRDDLGLAELSMGMSGDLEAALEAGATIVRIGTALFGPRPEARSMRR